jgi:serine/threonine protein kinase
MGNTCRSKYQVVPHDGNVDSGGGGGDGLSLVPNPYAYTSQPKLPITTHEIATCTSPRNNTGKIRTCTASVQTDITSVQTQETQTYIDELELTMLDEEDAEPIVKLMDVENMSFHNTKLHLVKEKSEKKIQQVSSVQQSTTNNASQDSADDLSPSNRKRRRRRSSRYLLETSSNRHSVDDNEYYSKPMRSSMRQQKDRYKQSNNSNNNNRNSIELRTDKSLTITTNNNNQNVQVVITSQQRVNDESEYDSDVKPLKARRSSVASSDVSSSSARRLSVPPIYIQKQNNTVSSVTDHDEEEEGTDSVMAYNSDTPQKTTQSLSVSSMSNATNIAKQIGRKAISFTKTVRTGVNKDGTKTVNEYIMIKKLGRGTFGKVQLCRNNVTSEMFAIKIINRSLLNRVKKDKRGRPKKVDATTDILKEIAVLKKVDHPNIVKLYEVIDDPKNEKLYLVFEYVERGAVMQFVSRDKTDREPFSESVARKYFRDLLSGLEHLHDNKIIHRDIKPENLLVDDNDIMKLTDFGVSHMLENDDDILYTSAGTPAFLPPEACTVGTYNGKPSDIWSAGVTLYVMLYGCIPFSGVGILGIYTSIINDEPQFPENTNSLLISLFKRLLDKNPITRITMKELKVDEWITDGGKLVFADKVEPSLDVTEEEIQSAITWGESLKMIDRFVLMSKMKAKLGTRATQARKVVEQRRLSVLSASDYSDLSGGESDLSSPATPLQTSSSDIIPTQSTHPSQLSLDINFDSNNQRLLMNISNPHEDTTNSSTSGSGRRRLSNAVERSIILQSKSSSIRRNSGTAGTTSNTTSSSSSANTSLSSIPGTIDPNNGTTTTTTTTFKLISNTQLPKYVQKRSARDKDKSSLLTTLAAELRKDTDLKSPKLKPDVVVSIAQTV